MDVFFQSNHQFASDSNNIFNISKCGGRDKQISNKLMMYKSRNSSNSNQVIPPIIKNNYLDL